MMLKTEFPNLLEDINQSIEVILFTRKGEKIFEPEFGCGIWELLDREIEQIPVLIASIYDALNRWEKRIKVDKVNIKSFDPALGQVSIEIYYTVRESNERGVYRGNLS